MLYAHNYAALSGKIESIQLSTLNQPEPEQVCNLKLKYAFQRRQEIQYATISVSAWGELASQVSQNYLTGSFVQIEGYLRSEVVPRDDNVKQTVVYLCADSISPSLSNGNHNRVLLIGRTGGEPNIRHLESGSVVCNLYLAVKQTNKEKEDPFWFPLELWGKTASICGSYAPKGTQLSVVGALGMDRWSDKTTGHDRYKPVVQVQTVRLLSQKVEVAAS